MFKIAKYTTNNGAKTLTAGKDNVSCLGLVYLHRQYLMHAQGGSMYALTWHTQIPQPCLWHVNGCDKF